MRDTETLLREGRGRERAQAAFYRALAGEADLAGDDARAERLNGLLADEQHHVSRITARLLELGLRPDDVRVPPPDTPALAEWEAPARAREAEEIAWYEAALDEVEDAEARVIFEEILASERHHHEELGGKWMPAGPPGETEDEP